MVTEKIQIETIKEAPYNPRKISSAEMAKLKNSIKEYGQVENLVINKRTGNLVSGHQRLKALKELGIQEAEVSYVDIEEYKEKALNLALNKISGEWDEEKLIELLKDIESNDEEVLSYTGFSEKEIEILLDRIDKEFEENPKESLSIDDIKNPIVKKDDVFSINNTHRIICGDSSEVETYNALLQGAKIDLVVTSPPYNASIDYSEYKDNKELSEYLGLMEKVYKQTKAHLEKNRFVCINVGDQTKINLSAHHSMILEKAGFTYQRTVYWVKPEGAARATAKIPYPRWYRPKVNTESIVIYVNEPLESLPDQMEVLLVYSDKKIMGKDKPETKDLTPIHRDLMRRYASNVWKLAPETHMAQHPAPFPISLPENCIRFYSLENEIILDPFLGGGTSLVAAEVSGRKGYGIELDPKYVELSLRRFKQLFPKAEVKCVNREVAFKW